MSTKIAYCGLDCGLCPALQATQANDLAAKERVLAQWRMEYNSPEMTLASVTCDGCTSVGRHGGYCGACPVRACAQQHSVPTCAHCADYGCATLEGFLTMAETARANLEAIRRPLVGDQ